MEEVIINESFEDLAPAMSNIEEQTFTSKAVMQLNNEVEEMSSDGVINELVSYPEIQKRLTYALPHQPDGALRILRDMDGTALLADEVGLGKTITAGIVLKEGIERGLIKRALILTPPSLVDQWVAELNEKFQLKFDIIENSEQWANAKFVIASIDRVKFQRNGSDFKHKAAHEVTWDLLIVDEAHKLKDRDTVRWEFVDKLKKKRFLILTATPFQNDLLELYNLLHLLKRGHLGTMKEFREKFLFKGNKRYPLNPRELREKLRELMVRRRRDETTVDYKKRMPIIVPVQMTEQEHSLYTSACDLLKTKYFSANGEELNGRLVIFSILPKITSSSKAAIESFERIARDEKYHSATKAMAQRLVDGYKQLEKDSKIEKLVEVVKSVLDEDKNAKLLIYTKHPTTLRYVVEKLKPFNLEIVEFIGGLDREEKTKRIKAFKESARIMISTETGAEGLNFQFCNVLINYDLPWNPMSVEQRIGRLDRIGQQRDMKIFSLATKGTMEEHVVDLIINKMCCIGLVIGELPIILFNLGLDERGVGGTHKIEEMLMNAFIDSKNNLDLFASSVDAIARIIDEGIAKYQEAKKNSSEVLDDK